MARTNDEFLDDLVADAAPVSAMHPRTGAIMAAAAFAGVAALILLVGGWRIPIIGPNMAVVLLTVGALAIVGLAAAYHAIAMAQPHMGVRRDAPKWGMAVLALFPLAGMADYYLGHGAHNPLRDTHGWDCFGYSLLVAVPVTLALLFWLRRGAPTNARLAALCAGLAGGAAGSLAYGMACPIGDMAHLFVWHASAPMAAAGVTAMLGARWLRW